MLSDNLDLRGPRAERDFQFGCEAPVVIVLLGPTALDVRASSYFGYSAVPPFPSFASATKAESIATVRP